MAVYHDEIEIEDFEYNEEEDTYYYPCPCGDQFQITKVSKCYCRYKGDNVMLQDELRAGEEVATCPSCSLIVKVIYNPVRFMLKPILTKCNGFLL